MKRRPMLKREVLPPRRRRPILQAARSATLELVCCALLGGSTGWLIAEAQNLGDEDARHQQAGQRYVDAAVSWVLSRVTTPH